MLNILTSSIISFKISLHIYYAWCTESALIKGQVQKFNDQEKPVKSSTVKKVRKQLQ